MTPKEAPRAWRPPETGPESGRLDSWKEIAGYLRRGARTVQRREREEALPVHRLPHEKLGSVYAYRAELDSWFERRAGLPKERAQVSPPMPSLAVLPFVDMSQDRDQTYFCEGIAEEIINALSGIKGLRTASRTSSFRFRMPGADSLDIGRQLRVSTLLEGSVRKSGDRLRIAVELISTENGFQLWAQRYDRTFRDVFEIQDEIAQSVIHALRVALTPTEEIALQRPPTSNIGAYDCYLRGRKYFYEYRPQAMEFAIQMFVRAITLDAGYAQAYAGLADCWSYLYLYSDRSQAVREQADWASQKAQEMDPQSAQAQASRGLSLSLSGQNDEADRAFETAVRLNPDLFEAHYFRARHCFVLGRLREAAEAYEDAARVRPEDYQPPLLVAQIYDDLGRHHDAAASRRKGVAIAEQHLQLNPDDSRALYLAANGLVALGLGERGRQFAERALSIRGDDPMLLYNLGCVFSLLGLVERALDCLEKAARTGLTQKGWYEHDSNLNRLREHPRFQQLIATLS